MNEILPWCIGGVLLLIVVVVIFAPKKSSGLSPEHHSELNKVPGRDPPRYDELRNKYAGDGVAQQQIDVYDGNTEYHDHLQAYTGALKSGNGAGERREEQWFESNYPDI